MAKHRFSKEEHDRAFERAVELTHSGNSQRKAIRAVADGDGAIAKALQRRFKRRRQRQVSENPPALRPGLGVLYDLCDLVINRLDDDHNRGLFQTEADFVEADRIASALREQVRARFRELSELNPANQAGSIGALFGGVDPDGILSAERVVAHEIKRAQQSISVATAFIGKISFHVPAKRFSENP